ncbi:TetR/AcrR family transcriptional regulator [Streptomyces sp. NPDC008343]|uniref:TetR/AcrR family transcriptional regulator n=1 Tax=Streptomyces sp. NPDC008343 TaxID=3364828 RepID=UPI0036ED00A3
MAAYVKASDRRRQLVAAARAVLGRQGMAGGTLRAVAAEAQVPLGTVHYIFPSKEQLLRAVLEDVVREISETVRDVPGTADDLESAMRAGAQVVWSTVIEPQTEQQIMQYELSIWALRTAGMAELARWQYEQYIEVITRRWTQAADHAGVTCSVSMEQLARLLLAGIDGLVLQYLACKDAERARNDLDLLVTQIVRLAIPVPLTDA